MRSGFDVTRAPVGIDDVPVRLLAAGNVAALVSRLPASAYGPDAIEQHSGTVSWLSPRAMAHDRVLTWAQDHGGVIPLPMFSMWGSDAAVQRSLGAQSAELGAVFDRVADADEFGLRVHRRDEIMLEHIDELDADVAALRKQAASASPGQRYLLERKLSDRAKSAIRGASQRMAKQVFEELGRIARASVSRPLTPATDAAQAGNTTMVLNAAFLVDRKRGDDFRAAVTSHARALEPRGVTFDFTGPWPPYNFVAQSGSSALAAEGAKG